MYALIEFSAENQQDLLELDKLTSTVIKVGGTISPSSRQALDKISPYLAKRILGEFSLPLQVNIKCLFDPNLVLMGDGHLFYVKADRQKSWV